MRMRQPLLDVKTLFERKIEENDKEREELVKARIESFYNRHRVSTSPDDRSPQSEGKVRPMYED